MVLEIIDRTLAVLRQQDVVLLRESPLSSGFSRHRHHRRSE
jgi:hypothetical protein